jgi:3-oxoacyl-[acyl-carrier-protein] synthase-3
MTRPSQLRMNVGITGVGLYVPEKILDNHDLEKMVDTSDDWIVERTGIRQRRIAPPGTPASDLGAPAALQALEMAKVSPEAVDCIIVATVTPDMLFPSTACILQEKIGAKNAWAFDLLGACSGYVYSLSLADSLVRSGAHKTVLVVGTEIMSTITNWNDRNTCILFGDAGAATVVQQLPEGVEGILSWENGADGSGADALYMKGGGSLHPPTHETVEAGMHYLWQDGKAVYRVAVEGITRISQRVLEKAGLKGEDVDLFIPHQANLRIMDFARRKLGLPEERMMVTIDRFGNTTSATIPGALRVAHEESRIKPGDTLLFATFGAGFTWGAAALRWTPASGISTQT